MVSFSLLNAIDPTTIIFIVLLALLIVALLVVPMFTNKKRAKQTDELHRSLKPGDLIMTIGGIIGTVVEVRKISPVDTEMIIETGIGDNKTTMTFDIQALYRKISRASTIVPAENTENVEHNEEPVSEPENAQPAREVPPIMADRAPEAESTQSAEEPAPESEKAENTEKEENAEAPVAEEKPEPVQEPATEQAATESEQKAAPVKKNNNGGAKKSVNGAKNSGGAKKNNKK